MCPQPTPLNWNGDSMVPCPKRIVTNCTIDTNKNGSFFFWSGSGVGRGGSGTIT